MHRKERGAQDPAVFCNRDGKIFAPAVYSSVGEIYGGDLLARSLKRSLCNVSARDLGKMSSVKISCKDLCTSVLYSCVAGSFLLVAISARDPVWWDILVSGGQNLLATRGEVACFKSNGGVQASINNQNILRLHRAPSSDAMYKHVCHLRRHQGRNAAARIMPPPPHPETPSTTHHVRVSSEMKKRNGQNVINPTPPENPLHHTSRPCNF